MRGYRFAVRWIADNDEPGEDDPETLAGLISVALVADLFEKTPEQVAEAVRRQRASDRGL